MRRSGSEQAIAVIAAIAFLLSGCGSPLPTVPLGTAASPASPTPESSFTSSPPATPPATPPTTSPTTSPSTSPTTFGGYRWIQVDPGQFGGVGLAAVTSARGSGYVAIGDPFTSEAPDGTPRHPNAWTSTDGRAWLRLPDSQAFVSSRTFWEEIVTDIVPAGEGFIAVGMEQQDDGSAADAAAWYSPDGRTWTRAKVPDGIGRTMDQVVATDHGFVAIGETEYSFHAGFGGGAAIWTSPDGRTWTRAHDKRTPPRGTALRNVVEGATGFLATARFEYSEGYTKPLPPVTAGIWRSTDAIHWEPIPGSPLGVAQVVRASDGFVAVGSSDAGNATHQMSWRSSDGRSWAPVELPPPTGIDPATVSYPQRLVRGSVGLLALGERDDDFSAVGWSSTDGTAWTPLDLTAIVDGATIDHACAVGGSILLLGHRMIPGGDEPVVWLLTP